MNDKKFEKVAVGFLLAYFLCWVIAALGFTAVIVHFIKKYW